jgi:hypothetical protein
MCSRSAPFGIRIFWNRFDGGFYQGIDSVGYLQNIVHLYAKISDSTFDLGMSEQKLNSPEITSAPVD